MIGQYFDIGTYSLVNSQLEELKKSNNPEALEKVAKELEAMFIYELLKVMRKTVEVNKKDEEPISNYNTIIDMELSKVLAERGMGLKELIIQSFDRKKMIERYEKGNDNMTPINKDNFRLPVFGNITSGFGIRKHPVLGIQHFHKGIDISAPEGTDIYPFMEGRVVYSGFDRGYGYSVVVEHKNGYKTRYAHNSINFVKEGDWVNKETVIGKVGKTGLTTGPHLHFEVIKNGEIIDPGIVLANK